MPAPEAGSVLGIDVGFSQIRRSSAVCRLDWNPAEITWTLRRFRATTAETAAAIRDVAGAANLAAAAFDGPVRGELDIIGRYRVAERMLTRRLGVQIGKPGQSNAPIGKLLNAAANACARTVIETCAVEPARHRVRILPAAIYEAFPSSFLGLMLADPATLATTRANRSDLFFQLLSADGTLNRLCAHLLPGRILRQPFAAVVNHDDRAALICALTALAVAVADFTAVGDAADGWIILPPARFIRDWGRTALEANARNEPGALVTASP